MKRNALSLLTVFATILVSAFSSCKKSDDSQSRKSMLTGQWTLSQLGTDANRNGIPDSGEMVSAAAAGQSALVNFQGNMTYSLLYTAVGVTDTFNGSWGLISNDAVIRTVYKMNSSTVPDTSDLKIYAINNNTLTVLDESDTANHVWETFIK